MAGEEPNGGTDGDVSDAAGEDETGATGDDVPGRSDAEDEPDWQMAPDSESTYPADAEKRERLREIADEVRARDDSSEASQVGAFLYRVSDLYKEGEETSIPEIYMNMRHILEVKEQGGLGRGRDDE